MPTTVNSLGAEAITTSQEPTPTKAKEGFGMDKDAFLAILVEQLRHQDPSQPGDSQQYIEQMTQFTMIEQLTNISEAVQVQHADTAADTAINLVGRTVTYLAQGEPGAAPVEKTGTVEGVAFGSDGPTLTVAGEEGIVLGSIVEVR